MPHTLSSEDQWFLNLKRKDPLTAGQFQSGDSVVVCTKCRTVHLTATWYFGAAGCKAAGCGCTSHAYHFGRETVEYPTLSLGKKTSASVGRSAPQGRSSNTLRELLTHTSAQGFRELSVLDDKLRQFIAWVDCPACGKHSRVFQPEFRVYDEDFFCDECRGSADGHVELDEKYVEFSLETTLGEILEELDQTLEELDQTLEELERVLPNYAQKYTED